MFSKFIKSQLRLHHSNSFGDLQCLNKMKNHSQFFFKFKYIENDELLTILFGVLKDKFSSDTLIIEESKEILKSNKEIEKIKNVLIGLNFSNFPNVEYSKFEKIYGVNTFVPLVRNLESYVCSKII